MMVTIGFIALVAPTKACQRVEFQRHRFHPSQAQRFRLLGQLTKGGEPGPTRWIIGPGNDLFKQEQLLANAHKRWLPGSSLLPVEVHQRVMEEGKELAEQQGDTHSV